MKALFLVFLAFVSSNAYCSALIGAEDMQISAALIDGHQNIPKVGDLSGSVISVYAGTAMAMERYFVTIGNAAAPCEGDDCIAQKVFEVEGNFSGVAKEIYSRKVDNNTYSIAILTKQVSMNDEGEGVYKNVKILIRVKFNKDGVSELADMKVVQI